MFKASWTSFCVLPACQSPTIEKREKIFIPTAHWIPDLSNEESPSEWIYNHHHSQAWRTICQLRGEKGNNVYTDFFWSSKQCHSSDTSSWICKSIYILGNQRAKIFERRVERCSDRIFNPKALGRNVRGMRETRCRSFVFSFSRDIEISVIHVGVSSDNCFVPARTKQLFEETPQ